MLKEKIRCPHCHRELNRAPNRTIECPYCEKLIYVRYDELCDEDDARKMDWRERNLVFFTLMKQR